MSTDFPKRGALTDGTAIGDRMMADRIRNSRLPGDKNGELSVDDDPLTTDELRARLKTYEEMVGSMRGSSSKDLDFAQQMIIKYRNEIRSREEAGR